MENLLNKKPTLTIEHISFDGSTPRNEFEIKKKIISELRALKSDKVGHINTINIDRAIDIVSRAQRGECSWTK